MRGRQRTGDDCLILVNSPGELRTLGASVRRWSSISIEDLEVEPTESMLSRRNPLRPSDPVKRFADSDLIGLKRRSGDSRGT